MFAPPLVPQANSKLKKAAQEDAKIIKMRGFQDSRQARTANRDFKSQTPVRASRASRAVVRRTDAVHVDSFLLEELTLRQANALLHLRGELFPPPHRLERDEQQEPSVERGQGQDVHDGEASSNPQVARRRQE